MHQAHVTAIPTYHPLCQPLQKPKKMRTRNNFVSFCHNYVSNMLVLVG